MASTHASRLAVACFVPLALIVACGGATAQDIEGPAPDGGASTSSSSGSSGTGDASSASDGSAVSDSGVLGPNPKSVMCGADACNRAGDGRGREICCVKPGTPPEMKCTPELDRDACNDARRECDDAADCTGGDVCCAETNRGRMNTVCMPTCITGAPRWQVCKTSAECEGGIPCTTGICPKQGVYGFCVGAAIPDGCR